jgi:micrococcal nuclease
MRSQALSAISVVLVWVVSGGSPSWAELLAKVVTVHEGDRVTLRHDGRSEIVHLKDIDCPELTQPYAKQAKRATAAYVGGREVLVRGLTRDIHGRTTAELVLPDGRNVGRELVKEGLAWWRRTDSTDRSLEDLEELARAAGKGLWSEPDPVPPWKWKTGKKTSRKYSD